MGGTRLAFQAGTSAATNVTAMPTTSPTMIERGWIWRLVNGSDAPMALNPARSSAAKAMPKMIPMTEATSPIRAASSSTERTTWLPEAPTARISPSWRVRWATVILNALKMMKLPTKSAMAANASRKLRKMSTKLLN